MSFFSSCFYCFAPKATETEEEKVLFDDDGEISEKTNQVTLENVEDENEENDEKMNTDKTETYEDNSRKDETNKNKNKRNKDSERDKKKKTSGRRWILPSYNKSRVLWAATSLGSVATS